MIENNWKTNSSNKLYENPWIRVTNNQVTNPGGFPGDYTTIHFKNRAVGIIPLDEDLNTYVVGQYRYPLGAFSWEIPEGGVPYDEDLKSGALRELEEEAGVEAQELIPLIEFNTSNSVTDEYAIIYIALGLTEGAPHPDPDEDLVLRKLPFSELVDWVMNGKVMDSLTIASVLKLDKILSTHTLGDLKGKDFIKSI